MTDSEKNVIINGNSWKKKGVICSSHPLYFKRVIEVCLSTC